MTPRDDAPIARAVAKVVTGGQTGADRAATDVARTLGIPYGGFVPRGGWAEERPTAPGILVEYPSFTELASDDPRERTSRKVAAAEAVLVLVLRPTSSPGTALTIRCAQEQRKPLFVIDLSSSSHLALLESLVGSLAPRCTLDVAGPRESEQPGLYYAVTAYLLEHRSVLFGR